MWRLYVGAAVIVALSVAFFAWLKKHDDELEARVVAQINKQTEELADDAVKARAPALQPGAALRLRTFYCRDCEADVSSR